MEAENNVEYIEIQDEQGGVAIGLAPIDGGRHREEQQEREEGGAIGGIEQHRNLVDEAEADVHMNEACDDEDDLMLDVGMEDEHGGGVGGEEQPTNLEHQAEAEVYMDESCDEEDDLMLDVGVDDEDFVMDEESDDELLPLIQ